MSDRADTILSEGIRLFAERGFSGTALADIERAAGFAPGRGAIYRYFPDKEAIFRAAVRREIGLARDARVDRVAAAGTPQDLLERQVAASALHLSEHRLLVAVLAHDGQQFPDLLPEILDVMVDTAIALDAAHADAAARDAGVDVDGQVLASVLLDTIAGHALLATIVDPRRDPDPGRLIDVLQRLVRATFEPTDA